MADHGMMNYGMITEQGDLGLGWSPLNEKDNKIVNEAYNTKDQKDDNNKQIINDSTQK